MTAGIEQEQFSRAITSGDVEIILSILQNDLIDLNFRDVAHDLQTPVMRLCHANIEDSNMWNILVLARSSALDPSIRDALGRTLSMHACIAQNVTVLKFLTPDGYDIMSSDRSGKNVLHYGACSGSDAIIGLLLKHPDVRKAIKVLDYSGYSPLDLARQKKVPSIVRELSALLRPISVSQSVSHVPDVSPRKAEPVGQSQKPILTAANHVANIHAKPTGCSLRSVPSSTNHIKSHIQDRTASYQGPVPTNMDTIHNISSKQTGCSLKPITDITEDRSQLQARLTSRSAIFSSSYSFDTQGKQLAIGVTSDTMADDKIVRVDDSERQFCSPEVACAMNGYKTPRSLETRTLDVIEEPGEQREVIPNPASNMSILKTPGDAEEYPSSRLRPQDEKISSSVAIGRIFPTQTRTINSRSRIQLDKPDWLTVKPRDPTAVMAPVVTRNRPSALGVSPAQGRFSSMTTVEDMTKSSSSPSTSPVRNVSPSFATSTSHTQTLPQSVNQKKNLASNISPSAVLPALTPRRAGARSEQSFPCQRNVNKIVETYTPKHHDELTSTNTTGESSWNNNIGKSSNFEPIQTLQNDHLKPLETETSHSRQVATRVSEHGRQDVTEARGQKDNIIPVPRTPYSYPSRIKAEDAYSHQQPTTNPRSLNSSDRTNSSSFRNSSNNCVNYQMVTKNSDFLNINYSAKNKNPLLCSPQKTKMFKDFEITRTDTDCAPVHRSGSWNVSESAAGINATRKNCDNSGTNSSSDKNRTSNLEALLSPRPHQRHILPKRYKEGTMNLTTSHVEDAEDADYEFEEEIILDKQEVVTKQDKDNVGRKSDVVGEVEDGDRLQRRRSSLSLPDLRSMTGFLVTSRHPGLAALLSNEPSRSRQTTQKSEPPSCFEDSDGALHTGRRVKPYYPLSNSSSNSSGNIITSNIIDGNHRARQAQGHEQVHALPGDDKNDDDC